jgi:5,10-methylenetetrahydromethanopterin reductase
MPPRGTVTWGVGATQSEVLADVVGAVGAAEEAGFDYFWYGNEKLHPDMWVGLTAAALNSTSIGIGTFIVDPYVQHPAVTAATVATLDHYSGGRAVLVLGAGGSGLHELGLERTKPLAAVEDTVEIVRALLRGERVEREGPRFPARAQLHFAARADLPIWIATRGDRMLELAGRIADGVMIGTIARAEDIAAAVATIERGAASAGRSVTDVTVSARVDVAVAADRDAARDTLRSFVAGVLSASYPDRGFVRRAGLELPEELEEVCRTKDLRLAWSSSRLVPDDAVDAFTWAGPADYVAARVAAAVDAGADNVTVVFHSGGGAFADQLQAFAHEIVPRVDALLQAPALAGEERG